MVTHDLADEFLRTAAEAGTFRGAVLLWRNEEILLRNGYGFANEEWRISNSATTKFRIGSVTKMFTAAVVLRLADRGLIDLDSGIGKWLSDLPDTWRLLTPHQLLTHTSGLGDHIGVPAKRTMNLTGAKPAELVQLIANQPLLTEPGQRWAYSNTGYFLLGMVIEKLSGLSYAECLNQEIFQPFGMALSGYDSAIRILAERASGYARQRDGEVVNAEYLDMSVPFSAGGLYSTLDDLLRFQQALHGGEILSASSYERMTVQYPEAHRDDWWYGYGMFIGERFGFRCFSHDGGVNGFLAVLQYYPAVHASLIVLSNLMDPVAIRPVVDRLAGLLLGDS